MMLFALLVALVGGLAVVASLAAVLGGRPAITLPGAVIAAAAFVVWAGAMVDMGQTVTAAFLVGGALWNAGVVGSRMQRQPATSVPSPVYPMCVRWRNDLTGRTVTVETTGAWVAERYRLRSPSTFAVVERHDGRFRDLIAMSSDEFRVRTLAEQAAAREGLVLVLASMPLPLEAAR